MKEYKLPKNVIISHLILLGLLTFFPIVILIFLKKGNSLLILFSLCYVGVILFAWYHALWKFPIAMKISTNKVEFFSVVRTVVIVPQDVNAIHIFCSRSSDSTDIVFIKSKKGMIRIHEQMPGVKDLIVFFTSQNPAIKIIS